MPDPLKIGLVGLGKAGLRHAAAIKKSGEAAIVAAADPSPAAEAAARELEIQHFSEYARMFAEADIDSVVVSLPHSMLYDAGMLAARHKKHLLMEKPMALTAADADALVSECDAADLCLMVNFAHRFRSECRQARDAIRAGTIGRPVMLVDIMASGASDLPPWVWDRQIAGGGMMMYNGIHSVDRLSWLANSRITSVSAASGAFSYPVEVEDNLVGTLTFANNAIGAVVQHKSTAGSTIRGWRTIVYGTRGALTISGETGLEIVSEKETVSVSVGQDNHFLGAFREFASAIRQARSPSPSGHEGVHALRAVLALYEAAETGRSCQVE